MRSIYKEASDLETYLKKMPDKDKKFGDASSAAEDLIPLRNAIENIIKSKVPEALKKAGGLRREIKRAFFDNLHKKLNELEQKL